MKKILISPSSFGKLDTHPLRILQDKGYSFINNPYGRKLTEEETIELGSECLGIIAGVELYNKKIIDNLPSLRCISRVGVGMDSIDLSYAKEKGISILNTPNGPTQAVAELALGLTMSCLRYICQAHYNMKNQIWKKENGYLLKGKTIGIFGLGRIGKKTAEIFLALGCKVIGFDIYEDYDWAANNGFSYFDKKYVLENSDIIILHMPGPKDGKPIFNRPELSLMKDSSFLINLARGGVVNEEHLISYLKSGKFSGVALDVFQIEPYKGVFSDFENVILTPHLGSYAREGKIKMEIDSVNNLINELEK